jgi:hypothetical protein
MTATLFAMLLAAPVPAEEGIKPPKGPPPAQVLASVTSDGDFEVTRPVTVPETQTRERTVTIDGRSVKETYSVTVFRTLLRTHRTKPEGIKVYTADGKEVDAKELPGKLKKPMAVLWAADNQMVDPFYLKIVKPDTLVIVPPKAPEVEVKPVPGGAKPPEPIPGPGRF